MSCIQDGVQVYVLKIKKKNKKNDVNIDVFF